MNVQLKLSTYRHIAIAFMPSRLEHFLDVHQIEDGQVDYDVAPELLRGQIATATNGMPLVGSSLLHHRQASHTAAIANRTYAHSNNDFSYLGKENMLNFYLCSLSWHELLGAHLSDLEKQSLRQEPPKKVSILSTLRDVSTTPIKKQRLSNHGADQHTCCNRAASGPSFAPPVINSSLRISFNEYKDLPKTGNIIKVSKNVPFLTTNLFVDIKLSYLQGLQRFYNDPNADFKSIQQGQAIACIMERQQDLLCVLRTGGGKSLLFFLPAYLERERQLTTVVVVPFVSLKKDLVQRANALNLSYDTWHGEHNTLRKVSLLFVAVENCSDIRLHNHLSKMYNENGLARIVYDEVHLSVSSADWRSAMLYIHSLRTMPVPVVLLSATIPLDMEKDLQVKFASEFVVIREPYTARPSNSYSVSLVKNKDTMETILYQQLYPYSQRPCFGIIFVQTVPECTAIQASILKKYPQMNVLIYHGRLTAEEKTKNQDQFMKPTQVLNPTVIVATSAFSTGIDKPDISFTFHFGITDSLLEYGQSSGRAKRDPNSFEGPAKCLLITCNEEIQSLANFRTNIASLSTQKKKQDDFAAMANYATTTQCRRFVLQASLDAAGVSCFASQAYAKCDNCMKSLQELEQDIEFDEYAIDDDYFQDDDFNIDDDFTQDIADIQDIVYTQDNQNFTIDRNRRLMESAIVTQARDFTEIQCLLNIDEFCEALKDRCAICTLKNIESYNTTPLKHSVTSGCFGSRCYKCYIKHCNRNNCPALM
ncbi:hypothetical protein PS15p_203148 [Mucor circinelloides]